MAYELDLHIAAREGNLQDLKKALKAGADITSTEMDKTALASACDYKGSDACVEYLLKNGADPDLSMPDADGPLCYACMYGHLKRVKMLLEAGADVNIKGGYGRTPLMYATGCEQKEGIEIMRLLLDKGADISARNKGDDDAFTDALSKILWKIPTERFKLLIDNGYKVNNVKTKYYHGQTPLMWASFCGKLEAVKVLVEAGADVNQKNKDGESAIISAMQSGPEDHSEIVEYLLDHGADPDSKSQFGYTVLSYAASHGYMTILEKLVKLGANLEKAESYGNETALISSAYKGKLDVVKFLLEKGANIHATDSRGNTALHHAAWQGHVEIIKLLLQKGAVLEHRNKTDWNALLQSVVEAHEEAFGFLLEQGSSFEYHEKEKGATPLMIAAWKGSLPIVRKLLERGADPLAKDTSGKTFQDYAQENNSQAVLEFVREKFSDGGDNRSEK